MGNDTNLFATKYLKRYNPSSDQTLFGPIRRLPTHILSTLGPKTVDVSDHIEATEGIAPYPSTPPLPSAAIIPESITVPSATTLSNLSQRRKKLASKKKQSTPKKDAPKRTAPSKKCKTKPPQPYLALIQMRISNLSLSSRKGKQPKPLAICMTGQILKPLKRLR